MNYKTKYKNINKMAFSILLNYLLTSIFELLDKAIIGHYSTESFAVVGIAASILYAITGALGVLSGAFNIVATKEKGCKNDSSFKHTFMSSKLSCNICFKSYAASNLTMNKLKERLSIHFNFRRSFVFKYFPLDKYIVRRYIIFRYIVSRYTVSRYKGEIFMNDNYALTEAVFYILLSLCTPQHGYGIMQQTEQMSNGRVRLAAGTLYGALSNLCSKGWIETVPGEADSRRKEYRITALGKEKLETELKRLKELVENGERILKDR